MIAPGGIGANVCILMPLRTPSLISAYCPFRFVLLQLICRFSDVPAKDSIAFRSCVQSDLGVLLYAGRSTCDESPAGLHLPDQLVISDMLIVQPRDCVHTV